MTQGKMTPLRERMIEDICRESLYPGLRRCRENRALFVAWMSAVSVAVRVPRRCSECTLSALGVDRCSAAQSRHQGASRDAAIAARIADICCSAAIVVSANSQFADKPDFRCKE